MESSIALPLKLTLYVNGPLQLQSMSLFVSKLAIIPSNSTEPVFVLQESSSMAVSNDGRTSFTPWALSLLMTALAQSSAA